MLHTPFNDDYSNYQGPVYEGYIGSADYYQDSIEYLQVQLSNCFDLLTPAQQKREEKKIEKLRKAKERVCTNQS